MSGNYSQEFGSRLSVGRDTNDAGESTFFEVRLKNRFHILDRGVGRRELDSFYALDTFKTGELLESSKSRFWLKRKAAITN